MSIGNIWIFQAPPWLPEDELPRPKNSELVVVDVSPDQRAKFTRRNGFVPKWPWSEVLARAAAVAITHVRERSIVMLPNGHIRCAGIVWR